MAFQKWWYGGDAGAPPDNTNPFSSFGYMAIDTTIPMDGTLLRTLIDINFFTITTTVTSDPPTWDPAWYAQGTYFNLAISSTDGEGAPIPPLLPNPTQDDQALFIWTAQLTPRLDQYIVLPTHTTQVVKWEVATGKRLESFARRGPFVGDSRSLWLAWDTVDIGGFFNNDGVDTKSFMGATTQFWFLHQQPTM